MLVTLSDTAQTYPAVLRPGGSEATFIYNEVISLSPTTPQFDICVAGTIVGHISRGHSFLDIHFQHRGYFKNALDHLEKVERAMFLAGRFQEYVGAILEGIGQGSWQFETELRTLRTPHHIEYWRLASTAAYLLKRGYQMTPCCLAELHQRGLSKSANSDELRVFLCSNHLRLKREKIVLVLTKPA